jgi:hypothetical protein
VKVFHLVRDMFVAETMEEAEKMAGEHIINYMRWVCHWRGLGNHMDPGEELPETKHKLDLLNYEFLHKRNLLFGTPDYVVGKIKELQSELNLQNLQVWSNFPGIDHEACMRSIKLFNDEVMPKIQTFKYQFGESKLMALELRKFTKFVDKTFIEGGKEAKEPVLLVSVAAIFKNPWDGKGFVEDLKPVILDLAPKLGDLLVPELIQGDWITRKNFSLW